MTGRDTIIIGSAREPGIKKNQNTRPRGTRNTADGRRAMSGSLALWLLVLAVQPLLAEPDTDATALRSRLDRILTNHQQPKAVLAARVIELPGGRILYDREGHRPMLPASNMKLVIMAAAIDRLGKDHQFETVVAVRGKDLVVLGGGDPTFGDERLAERRNESITTVFRQWAKRLKSSGVKQIPGDIIVDDSVFDRQFIHPKWPEDQLQSWYEAPIGGLNFNANCTTVRVRPTTPGKPAEVSLVPGNHGLKIVNKTTTGAKQTVSVTRPKDSESLIATGSVAQEALLGPITVLDPGLYAGHVLKTVLASEGIRVLGKVVRERVRSEDGSIPGNCHIVAVHRAPLRDALWRSGKQSLGMMAEGLIKALGCQEGAGSWENGRKVVQDYLSAIGVPADQAVIDDGSGLSRGNRLSPAASTLILQHAFAGKGGEFELLRDSLAASGGDGTLQKRMTSPEIKGRVFAKTGYIKGVSTLAGYVHTSSDQWLAFAFFYNQAIGPADLKRAQDEACRLLVSWPNLKPVP